MAQLFVRYGDRTFPIDVAPTDTVDALRGRTAPVTGINADLLVFTFQGRELHDGTLADHGVGAEATVDAAPRWSRDDLVFLAETAEQAEQWVQMWEWIREVAAMTKPLSVKERNLFSIASKNIAAPLRAGIRSLDAVLQPGATPEGRRRCVAVFRARVGEKLAAHVRAASAAAAPQVQKAADDVEAAIFWRKFIGDQHRVAAEQLEAGSAERAAAAAAATESYQLAYDQCDALKPTNPIRLGMCLNRGVHLYEILDKKQEATQLLKDSFDKAIADLDTLDEDSYKDSTLIMQLMRDNLTLWTADSDDEDA